MVIILKQNQEQKKVEELIRWLEDFHVQVNIVNGSHTTILGLIGDTSKIDIENVAAKRWSNPSNGCKSLIKTPTENFIPMTQLSRLRAAKSEKAI